MQQPSDRSYVLFFQLPSRVARHAVKGSAITQSSGKGTVAINHYLSPLRPMFEALINLSASPHSTMIRRRRMHSETARPSTYSWLNPRRHYKSRVALRTCLLWILTPMRRQILSSMVRQTSLQGRIWEGRMPPARGSRAKTWGLYREAQWTT